MSNLRFFEYSQNLFISFFKVQDLKYFDPKLILKRIQSIQIQFSLKNKAKNKNWKHRNKKSDQNGVRTVGDKEILVLIVFGVYFIVVRATELIDCK